MPIVHYRYSAFMTETAFPVPESHLPLIVLVTGGRHPQHRTDPCLPLHQITNALNHFHAQHPVSFLLHGTADGTDTTCGTWAARTPDVREVRMPADWEQFGRAAGPIRNQAMVDRVVAAQPRFRVVALAFPGQRGTAHCTAAMVKAGLNTLRITFD